MSHKLLKRSKKHVEDEVANVEFKAPDNMKPKDEGTKNTKTDTEATNGDDNEVLKKSPAKDENSSIDSVNSENSDSGLPKRSMRTRSRSSTPLKKNIESTNGVKDEESKKDETIENTEVIEVQESIDEKSVEDKDVARSSSANSVEMDPLILDKDEEEAIPELQFDENDLEVESEGSNSRCKTRRSVSRNVSTPKTPKTVEQEEFEIVDQFLDRGGSVTPKAVTSSNESQNNIICEIDLNDSSDTQSSVSTSNISTRAVAGSDATRNIDLTGQDSGLFEENSFSNSSSKSFADTLKCLSGRKAIRSLGTTPNRTDYRKHVLKKNNVGNRGDLYADYESVEKISLGMKRKSRSFSPSQSKRVKREVSNFFSYLPNPFSNLRNSFKRSSTPKLLTMETKCTFDDDEKLDKIKLETGAENEKKWCNVM